MPQPVAFCSCTNARRRRPTPQVSNSPRRGPRAGQPLLERPGLRCPAPCPGPAEHFPLRCSLRNAYKRCRDVLDQAIAAVRPGVTTAEVVELFPRAEEFGFPDEEAAFALQYGHGVGLSIWEKPIFSRLVSFDHPETIEEGMVFALETFWPSTDGWSAARIEEQLVVTATGAEVITRFPAEKLLVAGVR